jgi:hypothetical protein
MNSKRKKLESGIKTVERIRQKPAPTMRGKTTAQDPPSMSVTALPKHLELFAQAVADGCNVREAAKRSGRKEGSGGYLNSRADITQRVAEIRSAMAKAAENDAATKMVRQCRSIDIDRNDIIMGLADIAMSGLTPAGARVSAWLGLADIFLLRPKKIEDVEQFVGWTADELSEFVRTEVVRPRIASMIGSNMLLCHLPPVSIPQTKLNGV